MNKTAINSEPANPASANEPGEGANSAFVVFQGGGAKGIVHVGALAAVEDLGLQIRGVAGTSAGAMVAALVAAGYSSQEMLDTSTGEHIIGVLSKSFAERGTFELNRATDLFSPKGWLFIRLLRWAGPLAKWGLGMFFAVVLVLAILEMWRPFSGMSVGLVLLVFGGWVYYSLSRGVGSVERIRAFVDHAIAAKMPGKYESNVTFRRLRESGAIPLKIVATNVTDQCVEVFSYERTPDVVIADAVAGSICLPVVFQPWAFSCQRSTGVRAEVAVRQFLDGGITSNLPVWTLDRERAAEADLATIAFSIQPDHRESRKHGHWAGALASAIIAGSMEIHTRAVDRMVHIPIGCSLSLFDFDARLKELCEAVDKARNGVADKLNGQLTEFPEILRTGCRQLGDIAVALLRQEDRNWWDNEKHDPAAFKVAFAVQAPREWQFTTPYHRGYGNGAGPGIDPTRLHDTWETLEPTYVLESPNGEWETPHYSLLIPVSEAESDWGHDRRRLEQPLIVVIETNIRVRQGEDAELESFLGGLADSVVGFVKDYRVYEAIQRSTEAS